MQWRELRWARKQVLVLADELQYEQEETTRLRGVIRRAVDLLAETVDQDDRVVRAYALLQHDEQRDEGPTTRLPLDHEHAGPGKRCLACGEPRWMHKQRGEA